MSEFEKELEKNMKLNKVAYERESIYSDFLVSKRDIERVFYDWQPLKKLVVVPQIVADYIETQKDNDFDRVGTLVYGHYKAVNGDEEYYEFNEWIACNFDTFLEAIVNGYTVEKEKLYVLKHIDMSKFSEDSSLYLSRSIKAEVFGKYDHMRVPDGVDVSEIEQCHFTQSEIDKLNIGSYEQKEV